MNPFDIVDIYYRIRWRMLYLSGWRRQFGVWYTDAHVKHIARFS